LSFCAAPKTLQRRQQNHYSADLLSPADIYFHAALLSTYSFRAKVKSVLPRLFVVPSRSSIQTPLLRPAILFIVMLGLAGVSGFIQGFLVSVIIGEAGAAARIKTPRDYEEGANPGHNDHDDGDTQVGEPVYAQNQRRRANKHGCKEITDRHQKPSYQPKFCSGW
jgi:hypothetical protein